METLNFFYTGLWWMPFFVALTYATLLLIYLFRQTNVPLSVRIIPIFALLTVAVIWLFINLLHHLNFLWTPLVSLLFLCVALLPVLFYHLVCRLTRLRPDERFPKWHYLLPALVFTVALLWSLPHWGNLMSLVPQPGNTDTHLLLPDLFYYAAFLRMVLILAYAVPSVVRIRRYQREAGNYSSDEYRISLRWLLILVVIFGIQIIITMGISLYGGKSGLMTSPLIILLIALLMWQMTLMAYNILNGNFELVANGRKPQPAACAEEAVAEGQGTEEERGGNGGAGAKVLPVAPADAFRQQLEAYIDKNRLYLKPDLRITDLVAPLGTNRAYLSAFINETYGMNFCRFINAYRLKEYERLRADEKNKSYSNAELAFWAGFSNAVSLYRTITYQKERGKPEEVHPSVE